MDGNRKVDDMFEFDHEEEATLPWGVNVKLVVKRLKGDKNSFHYCAPRPRYVMPNRFRKYIQG